MAAEQQPSKVDAEPCGALDLKSIKSDIIYSFPGRGVSYLDYFGVSCGGQ